MPAVLRGSQHYLTDTLKGHSKQLRKMATQQSTAITNVKGQPIVNIGHIPPQPGQATLRTGIQILNPGTGNSGKVILQLGEQLDRTTYGLTLFASDGVTPLVNLTEIGLNTYDSNGNVRVSAGELLNGDFGFAVTDTSGNMHEVNPIYPGESAPTFTTSSTTAVAGNGPLVQAPIGASGSALVIVSSLIGLPGNSATTGVTAGYVDVYMDGAVLITNDLYFSVNNPLNGYAVMNSSTQIAQKMTPGTHDFALMYYTSGSSVNFSANALSIWPY